MQNQTTIQSETKTFLKEYFPTMSWQPETDVDKSLMAEAFPVANPPVYPYGERVLFQVRTPKKKTAGGIILADDSRDSEKWNEQNAKVIAWGALAFRNRTTLEPWPDYGSIAPGNFVRIPLYGGDKIEVPMANGETALFVVRKDYEIISKIIRNPLTVKTCF